MSRHVRPALLLLLVMTLLAGLAYPLLVTGFTQAIFAMQTKDSLMMDDEGEPSGPELIDEPLDAPEYFWGRLPAPDPPFNQPLPMAASSPTSALDARINPGAAQSQAARIARERNMSEWQVRRLIAQNVEFRKVGMLGHPCVNVQRLNLALDAISPKAQPER